jgi:putative acetyltransferase
MQLRRAREEDVPTLARLYEESIRAEAPDHYAESQIQVWASFAAREEEFRRFVLGPFTLVAEDGSGVVGFGGLETDGRLASLFVRRDRVRHGVGTALLSALIEHGEREGLQTFRTEASEMSRGLFERFGFTLDSVEIVERDGETLPRYRMVLRTGREPGT